MSALTILRAGGAKDFTEYKYITGKIEALAIVEREILELKKVTEQ